MRELRTTTGTLQETTEVPDHRPQWIILAGPNGSGKSTTAEILLPPSMTFVNADTIAQQISGEGSTTADLQAGRILVELLDLLEERQQDFAVETTLATQKLVPRLRRLQAHGYETHLIFMWLQSPDLAVARVMSRVRMGGHFVPESTVRRRYERGLRQFFNVYRSEVDHWRLYDNSRLGNPIRIASGGKSRKLEINQPETWDRIVKEWGS